MITDRQLQELQELLTHTTPGPWISTPNNPGHPHNGAYITSQDNDEHIITTTNGMDAAFVDIVHGLLGEILEEVIALRALPGDHHQQAGLQRTLAKSRELRNLRPGSIVSTYNGSTWCSELDGDVIRWRNTEDHDEVRVSSRMFYPATVIYEPLGV